MKFWITFALAAWAIVGPFAGGGVASLKAKFITVPNERAAAAREATDAALKEAKKICDARVEDIKRQVADASEEARKLAAEAEASLQPTPEEQAARQAMCDADSMCRARNQGKGE